MRKSGLRSVPADEGRYSKVAPLPGSSVSSILMQKMLARRSAIDQHMAEEEDAALSSAEYMAN